MNNHLSDLLLAATVRTQQTVLGWAESVQPQAGPNGPVAADVTLQCEWVNQARDVEIDFDYFLGNLWGLLATYGGYIAIGLAIIIAVLGKFVFGRRLTGYFLWIVIGLLAVGAVVTIIQTTVASPCG